MSINEWRFKSGRPYILIQCPPSLPRPFSMVHRKPLPPTYNHWALVIKNITDVQIQQKKKE